MNLKNNPKETAYVKIILPRTLLPNKNATRSNKTAVTGSQTDRPTRLKSRNGFQRNLVDIIFRSRVARFATPIPPVVGWRRFREHLASFGRKHGKILACWNWCKAALFVSPTITRFAMSLNVWIKNRRRIATRYDKLAVCFLNFVILSALLIQI